MSMHKSGRNDNVTPGASCKVTPGFDRMPAVHMPPNVPQSDITLGDYIARKQRQIAFEDVANEKYLNTVNNPLFQEASSLVFEAEMCLVDMGMSKKEARGWIMAWASGAGDGIE